MTKPLKVSKRVRPGMVVQMRGGWVCPATSRTKRILGVWQRGYTNLVLLPSGKTIEVHIPAGVVRQGHMTIGMRP